MLHNKALLCVILSVGLWHKNIQCHITVIKTCHVSLNKTILSSSVLKTRLQYVHCQKTKEELQLGCHICSFEITSLILYINSNTSLYGQGRKEMVYLTTHSTQFNYFYMASDIWLGTILIVRKETRYRHIGYSLRLTARVLLHAPSQTG